MFLRFYTEVDRPFEDVEIEFVKEGTRWLPDAAEQADGRGAKVLSELGLSVGKRQIRRKIDITLGEPLRGEGFTLVPLHWKAADTSGLFPTLDGHVEIARLGRQSTQLGLSATYEPPFGPLGQMADRALFHRVAEITIKDFVERIGARIRSLSRNHASP